MAEHLPAMQALRALEAVARQKSLTRAAETLHVTHGAISHQIKSLEDLVGTRLVERDGRGVRVTEAGDRLAQRVRAALAELADAVREAGMRANPRRLRVSVVPSFAARWLLPRLANFSAAHPDLDLDVRASLALADFRRDDVDVAIRYGRGGWPGVVAEYILDDRFFVVCSPRYARGRLPKTPADLARCTLLRGDDEYWVPWFRAAGLDWPEPDRGPTFNDASMMLQAAVDGQGVALARTSLIGSDLRNGVLVRLFDVAVTSDRNFWLVYPPEFADSPKLTLFRAWLAAEIAAEAAAERRGGRVSSRPAGSPRPTGSARRYRS